MVKPTDTPFWQAAKPQGDVGLAGSAVADGVLTALDVFVAGQLHYQSLVHRGNGQEIEAVQALYDGETGGPG